MKRESSWSDIQIGLDRISQDSDATYTVPPACYASEDVLSRETTTLFHQSWIGIGRADRCVEKGDYFTMNLAGVPLIVIRDQEAKLRAFANTCRHRGSTLLQGQGQCRQIRCPFHCWTYDLDGRLRNAPRMEKCKSFDANDFGLKEFRLEQQAGFAFVCLSDDQTPLKDWLLDFEDKHWPWALDELVTTRVREFTVNCNWKAYLEVFNEYYHLPYVHPESLNDMYHEPDEMDVVAGQYCSQFGVTRGTAALLADEQGYELPHASRLEGRNKDGTRYTWCFPNMTFAACCDSLWMYEAYPLSTDTSHIVQTIAFPKASLEAEDFTVKAERYYERYDTAIAEDIPFLEQQQIGLSSPFATQGRLGTLEPGVARFAAWYADKMKQG